ncbi:EamA family transporter [Streptomyces sp. NPDC004787]|uniref:DMT family transporter n=1 Tax=Streptomyces sp. NPDC004787 TaxID=3154291 RepID=UPI0033BCEE32
MLWGTIGLAHSFVDKTGILTISGLRAALAACALLAYMAYTRSLSSMKILAEPKRFVACLAGTLSVTAFQILLFSAMRAAGVAVATLVAIGSAPVFTGVFDFLRKQRPGPGWIVCTVLGIAGLTLMSIPSEASVVTPRGVIYALAAGMSYSGYAIAAKSLAAAGIQPQTIATGYFSGAALLLLPAAFIAEGSPRGLPVPSQALAIVWLGIMATAVAYCLYFRGLSDVTASTAAMLGLAEPLTAAAIGFLLLEEKATAGAIAGMIFLAAGIVISILSPAGSSLPPRRQNLPPSGNES